MVTTSGGGIPLSDGRDERDERRHDSRPIDFFSYGPGIETEESVYESMPDDVREILEAHELNKREYRTLLKEVEEGVSGSDNVNSAYIGSWKKCIPSEDYIARNYGPGNYILIFQFRKPDVETGKQKSHLERMPICISEKFRDLYEDFQFEKRLARSQEHQNKLKKIKLKNALEKEMYGAQEPEDVKTGIRAAVSEMSEMAGLLGFQRPGASGGSSGGFGELAKAMIPALPAVLGFIQSQQQAQVSQMQTMMTLIMSTMNQSNQQLMEIMRSNSGNNAGQKAVEEFKQMISGVIDIKAHLEDSKEEKESVIDKLMSVAEKVIPIVGGMAQMSQAQRMQSPQYQMAIGAMAGSPDIQKMKEDPALWAEMVRRLDGHYGWEQTDKILAVVEEIGLRRPEECPRNPAERFEYGSAENEGGSQGYQSEETVEGSDE